MKTANTLCTTLMSAVALFCGNALAADAVTEQRVVTYSDLNLNHSAGIEALYRRIRGAARSVCGRASEIALTRRQANRQCVQDALDNAIRDVNNMNLTAYHQEKKGGSAEQMAGRR